MNKKILTSALVSATLAGSAVMAESTVTSSLSVLTFETGGTTYTGAVATSTELVYDFNDYIYGNLGLVYVTASGTSAFGLSAGAGYIIRDDLNVQSGTGMRLGAGLYLDGSLELNAATALSTDLIADVSISTPINDFGALVTYDVGVEYTPLGIYANYMNASFADYDLSMDGFGIGYRSRF